MSAEGEDVGTRACEVVQRAPGGAEGRCAGHGHNLFERHGDIHGVAVAIGTVGHLDTVESEDSGLGGITEGHADKEVLVTPSIVIITTGIETCGDVRNVGIEDHGAGV